MRRKILIAAVVVFLLGSTAAAYYLYRAQKYAKEDVPAAVKIGEVLAEREEAAEDQKVVQAIVANPEGTPDESTSAVESTQNVAQDLPKAFNLDAPFYALAPHGNWNYPWQEACEEASVLLVANVYLDKNWTRDEFNDQILALVQWEKENFGAYEHTNIAQTAQILNDYLGLETKIHTDPTFEDVKKILNKGHLIVMTFAGKQLGNPNYKSGGPIYHAMLIKGYKEGEKIITHDVGTRNGENYVYKWSTIQKAMHDYAEPIDQGAKSMIEVIPPNTLQ